ncbi:agmatine deiminase [Entomortierella parvispora]|uniref:Agmatine deiminase n=1 Tax=Entomortierella parvispora TaxID=205924 RepID=A0A9P3LV73_9FUNG|nr:agmatine deiminase [Entomortierella parvispora]
MGQSTSLPSSPVGYRFAPEWEPHQSTIMSWPTGWEGLNSKVQSDIARVAQAISKFEYVQVLVPPSNVNEAKAALGNGINIIPMKVDDLWARDTSPLFMTNGKGVIGWSLNFNGWGRKQPCKNDARVATSLLDYLKFPVYQSELVAEGGSIETDGEGTLMLTESSIVNNNRNPGKSRDQIEQILKSELNAQKVIWVKGVKGHDITDSHIDSLARFVAPGVVMVSRPFPAPASDKESQVWIQQYEQAMGVLRNSTDAKGRQLQIIELPEPDPAEVRQMSRADIRLCQNIKLDCEDSVTSYVNFYIANGGVVLPQFGDVTADRQAVEIVQKAFPSRQVVAVSIDYLAVGGK